GADLANLMNESALLTARRGKKVITQMEVTESMERVIAGPERKGRVLDEKTKHTIAYHESGHALIGHLLPHADPVHKISIISRGRALGYTLSIPKEDKVLNSLAEMLDELAVFMGGRVAEEIFCEDITTGASNDLERATKMARAIVTQYGMSKELGTQVFGQPNHEVFLGRDYGNTQDYSEETAKRIDDEVARIMKEAHDRAYKILDENREQIKLMASVLLERETVEGEACEALLDNKWDDYLSREDEIIAKKEAEEAAARAKDDERLAAAEARRREFDHQRQMAHSKWPGGGPSSMPPGQDPFNPYNTPPGQGPYSSYNMPGQQDPRSQQSPPGTLPGQPPQGWPPPVNPYNTPPDAGSFGPGNQANNRGPHDGGQPNGGPVQGGGSGFFDDLENRFYEALEEEAKHADEKAEKAEKPAEEEPSESKPVTSGEAVEGPTAQGATQEEAAQAGAAVPEAKAEEGAAEPEADKGKEDKDTGTEEGK
ncbi:MAG: ATP-dependent metallopeptidase FtsH/Yme1/Tma family protein, partial [Eggerthellaceae bacterium]|nr:ATP-dependent metallopeptidase FtsH/Yme1/Tma family protein [Eggerthellaceae bacterium]